jgi:hypothetical protein
MYSTLVTTSRHWSHPRSLTTLASTRIQVCNVLRLVATHQQCSSTPLVSNCPLAVAASQVQPGSNGSPSNSTPTSYVHLKCCCICFLRRWGGSSACRLAGSCVKQGSPSGIHSTRRRRQQQQLL